MGPHKSEWIRVPKSVARSEGLRLITRCCFPCEHRMHKGSLFELVSSLILVAAFFASIQMSPSLRCPRRRCHVRRDNGIVGSVPVFI